MSDSRAAHARIPTVEPSDQSTTTTADGYGYDYQYTQCVPRSQQARAALAFDAFVRGEIEGFQVTRSRAGAVHVKRFTRVLEDD